MNKALMNMAASIFFIVFGFCMFFLKKTFAQWASKFYQKLLNIHFSEKIYQIGFFICGLLFIILGCLSLIGIIKFR